MSANTVLVVEDDPSFSAFVGEVAKAHGFEAEILEDGESFCERCSQRAPVLVILDLNVPGLDGIEMLRWLSQRVSSSLVLLISGVDPRVLRSALRLGSDLGLKMVGALPKPVELVDLEAVFDRCGANGVVLSRAYLAGVLARDELQVVFQPKIELATGRVCGWEALSRWSHPVRGALSPNEFVPWFEQEGLHVELIESVVRALGRELPRWGAEDGPPSVALNLTPLALDDLALPDRLAGFVSRMGLDPSVLTIEVTETAAMREPRKAADILARLRLKGFKLALDDFGAGHSSLAWLHRFPVSELKIDKAFMRDLIEDSDAQAIVSSIVRLGHELGVVVCAEGVENHTTHAWLRQLGCDLGQGFLYARPLPCDEIASWLSHGPRPWYESQSGEASASGLRTV